MSSKASVAMPSDASAKVQRLTDRYAAAWNASDMDAMAKLYADDVHWVNIVGMHWQGKVQVDQAHRAYFDLMFKGVPLTLEAVESVVALPGGAVVAVIRWAVGAFKTPLGEQMPPSRDRMSLVLTPRANELVIAHGSNVQINEQAQRFDPISQKPR
ncbi:MAG: SgcJ/EcaC family oxidoreductase [Oxalobacteraceae bacterium]|nr:MAG: SgcJ/EcaC family oxidoreductase [Oxalobacteraceae bacterium]